jgi:hypothetical protein
MYFSAFIIKEHPAAQKEPPGGGVGKIFLRVMVIQAKRSSKFSPTIFFASSSAGTR